MTRFEQAILGEYGEYWKNNAEKGVEKAVRKFNEETFVKDGVVRWITNGRCVPEDMAEKMEYGKCQFDRKATAEARKAEDEKFMEAYCKSQKSESDEEIVEMTSAFGKGTTVVDVLTGRKIQL